MNPKMPSSIEEYFRLGRLKLIMIKLPSPSVQVDLGSVILELRK